MRRLGHVSVPRDDLRDATQGAELELRVEVAALLPREVERDHVRRAPQRPQRLALRGKAAATAATAAVRSDVSALSERLAAIQGHTAGGSSGSSTGSGGSSGGSSGSGSDST